MEIFNGSWSDKEDVCGEFDIQLSELDGVEILYAIYDQCGYEGDAWVLFCKGADLYEVNASHCSCNDFHGAWRPALITVKALLMRPDLPTEVRKMLLNRFDN